MAVVMQAGRLELVPPAAPGFSPVTGKEEVISVCAKSITGDQVAQLYNRDPFAFPVWRAPVYRTPAGFILLGSWSAWWAGCYGWSPGTRWPLRSWPCWCSSG